MAYLYENINTERSENENYNKEVNDLREENGNLKSEINKLRTQLQDSQNELHSFRERMGKVVDLKLGSSGVLSEDLSNPCRESELKRMYEKLSRNQWAKLLRQLKNGGPESKAENGKELRKQAENTIKDVLRQSQDDILNITNTMKRLAPSSQGPSNRASQYFDLAIQNLQLAIYQEKKVLYNTDQAIPEFLRPLVDECYKTGCLMALHNPPLVLDLDNCRQGPFPPVKTVKSCPAKEWEGDVDAAQKDTLQQSQENIRNTTNTIRCLTPSSHEHSSNNKGKDVTPKEREEAAGAARMGSAAQPGGQISRIHRPDMDTLQHSQDNVRNTTNINKRLTPSSHEHFSNNKGKEVTPKEREEAAGAARMGSAAQPGGQISRIHRPDMGKSDPHPDKEDGAKLPRMSSIWPRPWINQRHRETKKSVPREENTDTQRSTFGARFRSLFMTSQP